MLLAMALAAMPGCQQVGDLATVSGEASSPAETQPASEPEKLAYLKVISFSLVPDVADPGHGFSAKVPIRNEGATESRPFEVEAQANLIAENSVTSYPIGGREVITLKPPSGRIIDAGKERRAESTWGLCDYRLAASGQPGASGNDGPLRPAHSRKAVDRQSLSAAMPSDLIPLRFRSGLIAK